MASAAVTGRFKISKSFTFADTKEPKTHTTLRCAAVCYIIFDTTVRVPKKMVGTSKAPPAESGPSEQIESLFNQLLEHQAFKTSPVLRAVLLFLWQHRNESVSEYAI